MNIGESNESPTHFFVRPKEEEFDPDLLDEHDSFYHTTKSLLVLFQIMGVMPIMRSPPGMLLQLLSVHKICHVKMEIF